MLEDTTLTRNGGFGACRIAPGVTVGFRFSTLRAKSSGEVKLHLLNQPGAKSSGRIVEEQANELVDELVDALVRLDQSSYFQSSELVCPMKGGLF